MNQKQLEKGPKAVAAGKGSEREKQLEKGLKGGLRIRSHSPPAVVVLDKEAVVSLRQCR